MSNALHSSLGLVNSKKVYFQYQLIFNGIVCQIDQVSVVHKKLFIFVFLYHVFAVTQTRSNAQFGNRSCASFNLVLNLLNIYRKSWFVFSHLFVQVYPYSNGKTSIHIVMLNRRRFHQLYIAIKIQYKLKSLDYCLSTTLSSSLAIFHFFIFNFHLFHYWIRHIVDEEKMNKCSNGKIIEALMGSIFISFRVCLFFFV